MKYGGSTTSKLCALGPAGFPKKRPICRQTGGFPYSSFILSPKMRLDCHLVHTVILAVLLMEQSRSFPQQSHHFLASFARQVSKSNIHWFGAHKPNRLISSSPWLTQGRLRCIHILLKAKHFGRFLPVSRVSAEAGSTPTCHCGSPHLPLLPAKAPNWASEANTRNFIDVPFDGFLAPP